MESTSLDDVLYRYASFRNLVDPITHDLIISLARYIHCPKPVGSCGLKHSCPCPRMCGGPLSGQHRPDCTCLGSWSFAPREKMLPRWTLSMASSGTFSLALGAV